ncbi:MAG: type II secretion system protein GspK [Roseibacillus sp.]|nr:type II secretion system protein GspK [Roseibacillus sp.]
MKVNVPVKGGMAVKTTARLRVRGRRGSTMVAVFWLISVMALYIFTAIELMNYEDRLVSGQVEGVRAAQMAEMGISVACNPVVERSDYLLLEQRFPGDVGFSATIESEGSRFNINSLLMNRGDGADPDKALLREMFVEWGAEEEFAQEVVDALVDWVDENELEELNGAEFPYYEGLGFLNRPYNRPFYSLDEMRLVRGMEDLERLYPNWRNWFTIWSSGGLDVNEADPEKLARAAEVSIDDASAIRDRVLGADMIRGTEDDQPFNNSGEVLDLLGVPDIQRMIVEPRLTANDPTTRIESTGWSGLGGAQIKRRITLIVRNRTGRPSILERKVEQVP